MNTDDHHVARRIGLVCAALLLVILLSLVACGPGVIGTGTGAPVPASDVAVCSSDFASALDCPPTGSVGAPTTGTDAVTWTDADDTGAGATVTARFTGNGLVIERPCTSLRFEGRFVALEDGRRAFAGTYVDGASSDARAGFVFVTADNADASRLHVLLVDADGAPRHGPWLLRPVGTAPSPGAC